jgi:hypothetical protein
MARIKPEEIVDELSFEFRAALGEAVKQIIPEAQFDEQKLFQAFKHAVRKNCRTWETVRDSYVESKG